MVELLAGEKRRLLAAQGHVTRQDFEAAWERSWELMRVEHAWPHDTEKRRGWREAQDETKEECCSAFLGLPTPFAFAAERLREAAAGMCLRLAPEELGKALLAAVTYVEVDDAGRAGRASEAASVFVAMTSDEMERVAA